MKKETVETIKICAIAGITMLAAAAIGNAIVSIKNKKRIDDEMEVASRTIGEKFEADRSIKAYAKTVAEGIANPSDEHFIASMLGIVSVSAAWFWVLGMQHRMVAIAVQKGYEDLKLRHNEALKVVDAKDEVCESAIDMLNHMTELDDVWAVVEKHEDLIHMGDHIFFDLLPAIGRFKV